MFDLKAALSHAAGTLQVMTTTSDLAALAQEIGGDKISVESIARGYQDPHFVEAKPSFLLKLRKTDLLMVVGLELEIGWLPPLITQSTNPKIQVGAPGYFDASRFAQILEMPTGQVTRAEGDVHPLGNPHYWLDPQNGLRIAKGMQDKLSQMQPANAAYFAQRYAAFEQHLKQADQKWLQDMKPYSGRKIVTYHRSWPNFAKHFNLDVIGYVEPRPGIPPSPSHTITLLEQLTSRPGGTPIRDAPTTPTRSAMKTLLWSASFGDRLSVGSLQLSHLKKPPWPRPSGLPPRGSGIGWRRTREPRIVQSLFRPSKPLSTIACDGRALNAT